MHGGPLSARTTAQTQAPVLAVQPSGLGASAQPSNNRMPGRSPPAGALGRSPPGGAWGLHPH
jgi:hypothetical protein